MSEYFPDGPESFDNPEIFLIMSKVTRQSSIILDGETIFHAKMIYAHFFVANTINAHFFVAKVI